MLETALIAAIISVIGLVFLALKGGKNFVLKILGYDAFFDIGITVLFTWLFAASGTISGLFAGLITGVLISFILLIAKKTFGYMRLEKVKEGKKTRRKWVQYPPFFSAQTVIAHLRAKTT
jgi:MFS superfamily sulfate permease-like transporter